MALAGSNDISSGASQALGMRLVRAGMDPDETPLRQNLAAVGAALFGGAGLVVLLSVVLIVVSHADGDGYQATGVAAVSSSGLAAAALLLLTRGRVPVWAASVLTAAGIIAVTLAGYYAGEFSPYTAIFYIWIGTFVFLFLPPSAARMYIGLTGVCYAILLARQPHNPAVVARWMLVMAGVCVNGAIMQWLFGHLRTLALSEHEAREEALAATEAKSAFLATMSHEIRTPLNATIGMTQLLLDTPLSAVQVEYARTIQASGEALLAVINDILDFSKIEAGRLELEARPFDIRQTIEQCVDVTAPAAAAKALELVSYVHADVPASIIGDATRLRQILLNLLNNAVKFTTAGEVVLEVAQHTRFGGTPFLHITVRDTGIGIPREKIETLFESFTQLDASTTRRFGGTGLGLTISRRLAEAMGGMLRAESSGIDRGSTFHLEIPLTAAEPVEVRPAAVVALDGLRILVVDDNATNRQILRAQLEQWHTDVHDTGSPREALAWLTRGDPFEIAIVDMHMPEMDGTALARTIHDLRGSAVPVLIMTSLGDLDARANGQRLLCLVKPVKQSHLLDALVTVLADRPAAGRSDGPATVEVAEFDHAMAQRHPLRILLAEDNALNAQIATELLSRLGYDVAVVADGEEVVQALHESAFDVVLMDVHMPKVDGFEAARRVCREFDRDARPTLIALTASAMAGDREACLAAGMDDYVAKPIRIAELTAALERARQRAERSTGVLDTLHQLVGNDEHAIAHLLDVFIESGAPLLDQLVADRDADDLESFTRNAHTLKSNAAALGAATLASTCAALESAGKAADLGGVDELMARARVELQSLVDEVDSLRMRLR
ncbi:MAG TPA: response regulator [Acidimicrobiia bacterium]|nr:response regulator [Acidimicrobiia bacterium]